MPCLHSQQCFHADSECLLHSQSHLRRQCRFAMQQVGKRSAPDSENLRSLGHRQAQFFDNFLADKFSRVRRGHVNFDAVGSH